MTRNGHNGMRRASFAGLAELAKTKRKSSIGSNIRKTRRANKRILSASLCDRRALLGFNDCPVVRCHPHQTAVVSKPAE